MTTEFTVLAVCTGNICRSPAMERLFAQVFTDVVGLRAHSGGTHAHDGEDMQPLMKQRVRDFGADAENFVARQVTAAMVARADLVLTATGVQLQHVTDVVPEVGGRTFTIRELGRLLRTIDADGLREAAGQDASELGTLAVLVPLLDAAREDSRPVEGDEDVVDPYLLSEEVYDESFGQIIQPIEALAALIR